MYNHVPALEGCHLFPFLPHLHHHGHQHPHFLEEKKRESVMTRLKNYIVYIHNSKKYKTICSILLIFPTSVYILS